jgi:hypothetical protein
MQCTAKCPVRRFVTTAASEKCQPLALGRTGPRVCTGPYKLCITNITLSIDKNNIVPARKSQPPWSCGFFRKRVVIDENRNGTFDGNGSFEVL